MKNIGIIYCPSHRLFHSTEKRWKRIAAALQEQGVDYDMIQSESADSVGRIFMMLLNNNYETIVIAGGDSALNVAVNCLMSQERSVRERTTIGVIPNGAMNDFAKFWGLTYDDVDYAVRSIKQRRIRKVDVGNIHYRNDKGEQKTRYFINCINIGLLASIQRMRQTTRRYTLSRRLSFVVCALLMLFTKKFFKVKYTIDFVTETHRISTMCIGSALGYGQTPNAVPYSGLLDVTVVRHSALSELIGGMYLFAKGKILNHERISPYRSKKVDLELGRGTPVSVDGHMMEMPQGDFTVTLEKEEINFIMESYS